MSKAYSDAGLPQITTSYVCEEYVVSKQHQNQFPREKSWRARKPLELIHSDICGPITLLSNEGKRYIITFIDDYNWETQVYFLQEKFKALKGIKQLLKMKMTSQ